MRLILFLLLAPCLINAQSPGVAVGDSFVFQQKIYTVNNIKYSPGQVWRVVSFKPQSDYFTVNFFNGKDSLEELSFAFDEWKHNNVMIPYSVYKQYRKKYGTPALNKLLTSKVWIGMTKDQAIIAWGHPDRVNTTTTKNGSHEQWVFDDGAGDINNLYFENGRLTTIQH